MLHCYAPKWANVEDEVLQLIISSRNSSDPCIYQMQRGLEVLGMLSALTEFPMLHYLLRPTAQHKLNVAKLLHILKPEFSPEGSNSLVKEKETYQAFVRYTRDVAASRRVCGNFTLNLGHILQFTTGASEEPVLGFIHPPSLHFILPCAMTASVSSEGGNSTKVSFFPFAHTCSNILELPRATVVQPLPTSF